MGLMFRPRRPVARLAAGAATAGIAYHAGKKNATQAQYNEQAQAAYESTQAQPQPQYEQQYAQPQYAPPPPVEPAPAPAAPASNADMDQLEKLAEMHGAGTLTDEEFSAAKAKLLGL